MKLGSVIEGTDPFPSKPSILCEFAERFDTWVEDGRLEEKTKKFYRNGSRLLKATPVAGLRVEQIAGDFAELLKFPGSAVNAKLRFEDVATNAAQSRGVEGDRPRSENQNDERARSTSSVLTMIPAPRPESDPMRD